LTLTQRPSLGRWGGLSAAKATPRATWRRMASPLGEREGEIKKRR
jgi:hypothetical protein